MVGVGGGGGVDAISSTDKTLKVGSNIDMCESGFSEYLLVGIVV